MPDEKALFQTGRPWSELALLGELDGVITYSGQGDRTPRNVFLHQEGLYLARRAMSYLKGPGRIIDFGCGTGRFVRYFGRHGHSVLGTDITPEMLEQARKFGLPAGTDVVQTDGIAIPVPDASVDLIFISGVLRYSLNVPNPVYDQIAREMYRVLKPGGRVFNVEVYVDQPATDFTRGFEAAGFATEAVRVAGRHFTRLGRHVQSGRVPLVLVPLAARLLTWFHYHFDSSDSQPGKLRDCVFVWKKPLSTGPA